MAWIVCLDYFSFWFFVLCLFGFQRHPSLTPKNNSILLFCPSVFLRNQETSWAGRALGSRVDPRLENFARHVPTHAPPPARSNRKPEGEESTVLVFDGVHRYWYSDTGMRLCCDRQNESPYHKNTVEQWVIFCQLDWVSGMLGDASALAAGLGLKSGTQLCVLPGR